MAPGAREAATRPLGAPDTPESPAAPGSAPRQPGAESARGVVTATTTFKNSRGKTNTARQPPRRPEGRRVSGGPLGPRRGEECPVPGKGSGARWAAGRAGRSAEFRAFLEPSATGGARGEPRGRLRPPPRELLRRAWRRRAARGPREKRERKRSALGWLVPLAFGGTTRGGAEPASGRARLLAALLGPRESVQGRVSEAGGPGFGQAPASAASGAGDPARSSGLKPAGGASEAGSGGWSDADAAGDAEGAEAAPATGLFAPHTQAVVKVPCISYPSTTNTRESVGWI
ncbi:translation initiation factor IF-2-like [Sorex araneus]|uniref:translation initiation factor IF-2-like n=1 Tax=Sorex araneus TaxID=42254 RepID=UPI00243397C4|nr:translation initiation factor IF-2-like [Sorex araneus]